MPWRGREKKGERHKEKEVCVCVCMAEGAHVHQGINSRDYPVL